MPSLREPIKQAPACRMTHIVQPPFTFSSGPRDARIAFVGEAWGSNETIFQRPLVGWSGLELARMLVQANILPSPLPTYFRDIEALSQFLCSFWDDAPVFLTNVIPLQPSGNKIETLCAPRAEVGKDYRHPPLRMGHYLRPEFLPELDRLKVELEEVRPNLIVALGNVACWALLRSTAISQIRGTVTSSFLCRGAKVLPTFHPAYVLRQWSSRPIVVADLIKARDESAFPEIRRPERTVLINPTIPEIKSWFAQPTHRLAVDIETAAKTITCIGFARSKSDAIVIPFLGPHGGSHWQTAYEECFVWRLIQSALEGPSEKVFQNGLYDLTYLMRMGFRPRNCTEDTMLLHHSLHPELNKGLGFLGSLYTSEIGWKLMRRKRPEDKDTKADE